MNPPYGQYNITVDLGPTNLSSSAASGHDVYAAQSIPGHVALNDIVNIFVAIVLTWNRS